MKLPKANLAAVEQEKIVGYLLNPAHPDNGGKAAFFATLGFRSADWQILANALRELATKGQVTKSMETSHGFKYILEGPIGSPVGKTPNVRTIWIVDRGQEVPRLVTAYPHAE